MATDNQHNIDWINNLRVIALLAVIILHTASPLLFLYNKTPLFDWMTANFYNALVRFAVPVFVMISGALLLHREYHLADFLKKRLSRIVWPFLFWTLIYLLYSWYNGDISFDDSAWNGVKQILHMLKYGSFYHLWYVYMLIGLYLFVPVIGKFVRNATGQEIGYFLLVWFIVMMFNQSYLSRYKPQIELRYFEGYLGYMVLGHYLTGKRFTSKYIRVYLLSIFLFCLVFIIVGTYFSSRYYNAISTIAYEPISPTILSLSASVFLLARTFKSEGISFWVRVRNFIGKYTYGIYLGHALVLVLLEKYGISYMLCMPIISIPLTAFTCLALTLLLVYMISKLPFGKYISG